MSAWLLVSGDFVPLGGMDSANHGLAAYLARQEAADVHLVAHRVAPDLCALPSIHVHRVARPFGAHTLGEPLLRWTARREAARIRLRGGHVVANGGNVDAGDVSWVHYVHAAYTPHAAGTINAALVAARHARYIRDERRALRRARLVVCNSTRTVNDVIERVGVDPARVRRVYYGTDPARFCPSGDPPAAGAGGRPCVLFIGALGDRRKGFDSLFEAWSDLCRRPTWDADLLVAGAGAELPAWRARAARRPELQRRIRFTGYHEDVPALLRAADVVVHPARYEAYGLAVHEALCCGVPAIVSAAAGVAERYSDDLQPLLLQDPNSAAELVSRLLAWRDAPAEWRRRAQAIGAVLRARTWADMACEFAGTVGT